MKPSFRTLVAIATALTILAAPIPPFRSAEKAEAGGPLVVAGAGAAAEIVTVGVGVTLTIGLLISLQKFCENPARPKEALRAGAQFVEGVGEEAVDLFQDLWDEITSSGLPVMCPVKPYAPYSLPDATATRLLPPPASNITPLPFSEKDLLPALAMSGIDTEAFRESLNKFFNCLLKPEGFFQAWSVLASFLSPAALATWTVFHGIDYVSHRGDPNFDDLDYLTVGALLVVGTAAYVKYGWPAGKWQFEKIRMCVTDTGFDSDWWLRFGRKINFKANLISSAAAVADALAVKSVIDLSKKMRQPK